MCLFGINTIRRGRITGTDKERLEFYIVDYEQDLYSVDCTIQRCSQK